jgi:hypothetical protein
VRRVGSGHLEKTSVEIFAAGLSDRDPIANPMRVATQSHLIRVEARQVMELEEVDHNSLFRQALEIVAELPIDLAQ